MEKIIGFRVFSCFCMFLLVYIHEQITTSTFFIVQVRFIGAMISSNPFGVIIKTAAASLVLDAVIGFASLAKARESTA